MALFPEVEGPLRAWLKAQPGVAALTGGGQYVYFAAPTGSSRPDAWLTLHRIGGAPMRGDTPLDNPLITIQCWGRTKAQASQLAAAVVEALQFEASQPMGSPTPTVVALSAVVTLWMFQPDVSEGSSIPRVVVDASLVFRAA